MTRAAAGQKLDLGGGAVLTVLYADERGAVLLLEYGGFRVLLPVGMSFDALAKLQADESLPPITALLLADSGMAQTNPAEWINFLNPQVVVLSVSADNLLGLPSQSALDAAGGRTLLRTDANGWIEISSDGSSVWVETQRGGPAPTPAPGASASPTPSDAPAMTEEPAATEEPLLEDPDFTPEP